ncbi:MAG: ATP-binding protein [Rhodomicrobium sp.]
MIVQFGRFRLDLRSRELLADGVAVAIGSWALDVLIALIEARGELVSKDELMSRVWLGAIVEENTLQFQISAIRKALGKDREFIKTISGRGYRFVAELMAPGGQDETFSSPGAAPAVQPSDSPPPTNLPAPISELVGRESRLAELADLAGVHRLVTLVGGGGIGKTRLALELGRHLLPRFAGGVWVAELGPLSNPELVLSTVAAVLGLASGPDTPERLAGALASKHLLLILDNCEHVIDVATRIAEAFLRASTSLQVIATSREPLRIDGECVYLVPALDVPAEGTDDIEEASRHSAIRLFIARAGGQARLSLDARTVAAMVTICGHLDGIPLAIELAAASAAALGVHGVAARLDDRFNLLTDGRRTALPRHQTLRAAHDWSYELLSESERIVMRRLSIIAGSFTTAAASLVAAHGEIGASEALRCLSQLVTKSLVVSDIRGPVARFRLLETTRAYALEMLAASGEFEQVARHHAEYFLDLFEQAETGQNIASGPEWLAAHGCWIDDVRAALDWAFSPNGDPMIGVALTVASERLWFELSLLGEWRRHVECAISSLGSGVSGRTRRQMQLNAALGSALFYTKGPRPEVCAAWTDMLDIAENLDNTEYRLRALWDLWLYRIYSGECQAALALGQRFSSLLPSHASQADLLTGERMQGRPLHFLGDQRNARRHFERILSCHAAPAPQPHIGIINFQLNLRVTARGDLAKILWLQGFPDQAMRIAQDNVEDARAIGHELSLCFALDSASMIALTAGDLASAERYLAMLAEQSAKHTLGFWQGWSDSLEGQLLIKRGDFAAGLQCLRSGLDKLREAKFVLRCSVLLGALAEGLACAGQPAEGLLAIGEALAHCERTGERWNIAELLRIKGELLLKEGAPGAAIAAGDHFLRALDLARQQAVLGWELRCASSLARLWQDQGRGREAYELLSSVYSRFTEGFETDDLKAARALLNSLQRRCARRSKRAS